MVIHTYEYECIFTKQNRVFWNHLSLQWSAMESHYYGKVWQSLFSAEDSSSKVSPPPHTPMFMVNRVNEKCKAISTIV